jgi:hypothetical protein
MMPAPASLQAMSVQPLVDQVNAQEEQQPFQQTQVHVRGSLEANDKQAEKHTAPSRSADRFLSLVRTSSGPA